MRPSASPCRAATSSFNTDRRRRLHGTVQHICSGVSSERAIVKSFDQRSLSSDVVAANSDFLDRIGFGAAIASFAAATACSRRARSASAANDSCVATNLSFAAFRTAAAASTSSLVRSSLPGLARGLLQFLGDIGQRGVLRKLLPRGGRLKPRQLTLRFRLLGKWAR